MHGAQRFKMSWREAEVVGEGRSTEAHDELARERWIGKINEKLPREERNEASSRAWRDVVSIYRVPESIHCSKDYIFDPKHVSIGPFYREELPAMDTHKYRFLRHILVRCSHLQLGAFYYTIGALEEKARNCYMELDEITSDEFIECMVLDGCFVLEILRNFRKEKLGYSEHDPIFSARETLYGIMRDMILLQNQIPHFILNSLLALQVGYDPDLRDDVTPLFTSLCRHHTFFGDDGLTTTKSSCWPNSVECLLKSPVKKFMAFLRKSHQLQPRENTFSSPEGTGSVSTTTRNDNLGIQQPQSTEIIITTTSSGTATQPVRCLHFLDFIHHSLLATKVKKQAADADQKLTHSVAKLRSAGITFCCRQTKKVNIRDIKFENGVLEIPRLIIKDGTMPLFLNLIAFEECHNNSSNDITAYAFFMDDLINTKEDVQHLYDCGIIQYYLLGNEKEVATWFNKLTEGVLFDPRDSYLSDISKSINRYYENNRYAWWISFKEKYFTSPWSAISLVGAILLLVLTMLQTIYTMVGYHKPK